MEKNNKGREKKLIKKKLNGWKLNTVNPPKNKGNKNITKNLLLKKANINYFQFFLVLIFLLYSFYNNLYPYSVYNLTNEEIHGPTAYQNLA